MSTDVILDYGDPFNVSSDSYQEVCPGQRGALRQEYIDKGVTFVPNCGDFTQSVPTPSRYSFGQWNSGTYSWAFLRATVTSNTECFLQESGTNPPLSSGYRNPVRQQDFGSVNSRHVHGDAADLDTPNAPDNALWNTLRLYAKGGACSDACVEPRSLTPGHFHVDYRGSCPAGW